MAAAATATLAPAGAAAAAPSSADLVIGATVDPTRVGPAGGPVLMTVSVRNTGGADATGTAVKINPPSGVTADFGGEGSAGWNCNLTSLSCKYGTLAGGATAQDLYVYLRLPPGDDGSAVTVRTAVETDSREASTTNNTASSTVRYLAAPDLVLETTTAASTDISTLGGWNAMAYVGLHVTNPGTADAPNVRLTVQPPAGSWVDTVRFAADVSNDGWQCDFSQAPWVCDHGAVEMGGWAHLNLPVRNPPGTEGDTLVLRGSVSTTVPEWTLDNNGVQVEFHYVVPPPADLEAALGVGPAQVKAGDTANVTVDVSNIGGTPAENVQVTVPLPAGVHPVSWDADTPGWTCTFGDDGDTGQYWRCRSAEVDATAPTQTLHLVTTVGPGLPDGALTLTATVSTSTSEQTLDNNTASGSTTYLAWGTITGVVWLDTNGDGQRTPDEPRATDQVAGITFPGPAPWWETPSTSVNPNDGTYEYRWLKPGRYEVRVHLRPSATIAFTTPDLGDDATDSDIIRSTPDYIYGTTGYSAVVDVVDTGVTTVDIGLVGATTG